MNKPRRTPSLIVAALFSLLLGGCSSQDLFDEPVLAGSTNASPSHPASSCVVGAACGSARKLALLLVERPGAELGLRIPAAGLARVRGREQGLPDRDARN